MRKAFKELALAIATVIVAPSLLVFQAKKAFMGRDRAIEGSTQALSLIPGVAGDFLRRAFLRFTLDHFDVTATVQFGTIFSQAACRIEENVYVGPRCHLGLVHLERDVLLAAGVHVPSGAQTHGTGDLDRPFREQPGRRTMVRIGEGTWVGSAAVVLADVGKHSIIGAGAVVTAPIPDYVLAAGVPARVIKDRRSANIQA